MSNATATNRTARPVASLRPHAFGNGSDASLSALDFAQIVGMGHGTGVLRCGNGGSVRIVAGRVVAVRGDIDGMRGAWEWRATAGEPTGDAGVNLEMGMFLLSLCVA